jgi:hypothetical protein
MVCNQQSLIFWWHSQLDLQFKYCIVHTISNRSRLPGCSVGLYPTRSTGSWSAPALNLTWSYWVVPYLDPPHYPARFCRVSPSILISHYNSIFYATIQYFSSDRIAIWSIYEACSFRRSVTSRSPICNPMKICSIVVKLRRKLRVMQSTSTIINQITNRRAGGEWASKPEYFTYGSYCNTIRTQILDWRESICCQTHWNLPGNRLGWVFHVVKSIATGPVQLLPVPWPEPVLWPRC